ncbi:sulfotransferase family protein [Acidiphilium sp.]|uniref:sulfotransferase family protein n=1 Tax=Acidiphilium sp. TaxID=527 RepID=UPI003CFF9784
MTTSRSTAPHRRFHFISGLPRSGSTLLAAILQQNPRFTAGMSGPVAGLVTSLLHEMSGKNEFSVFIDNNQRTRMLRGLIEDFYADVKTPVVFDTNRAWCSKLPLLATLFPDSKVIACVRNLSWIIDSVERVVRQNALEPSIIFNHQSGGTVYSRTNGLAGPDGLVGFAYDALKDAYYGDQAEGRLILVSYENLTAQPERTLSALYGFLGETPYRHDLNHLTFDAQAYDRRANTPGLHNIRPAVRPLERRTILPPELFQRFSRDSFWTDPQRMRAGVIVL